jgi:hypothetical protein
MYVQLSLPVVLFSHHSWLHVSIAFSKRFANFGTMQKCRSLNNFSTLTSIISALGTAPIARLKRTWDQVPQRTLAVLEAMRRVMASTKNFGEYREALHAANPPCIPFFGMKTPRFDSELKRRPLNCFSI